MKKARQPIVGAIMRSANQGGNMSGPHEAVSCNLSNNHYVIFGEAKSGRFRRAAESRAARRFGDGGSIHVRDIAERISFATMETAAAIQFELSALNNILMDRIT
jgi:hypothetical protein